MNFNTPIKMTKSYRTASLWKAIEEAVAHEQSTWFSGSEQESFVKRNHVIVDQALIPQKKAKLHEVVRNTLKTQLWENFSEDEYLAYADMFEEYIFQGNTTYHAEILCSLNSDNMTFDSLCVFMREWVVVHAKKLCAVSIQERNKLISTKLRQINDHLIGNPFSEKLITAIELSLQASFSKFSALEAHERNHDELSEQPVIWALHPKEKLIEHTDLLEATLPYICALVTMPNDNNEDELMKNLNLMCEKDLSSVNEGSFRSMVYLLLFCRLPYIFACETLGEYGHPTTIPTGMLSMLVQHAAHTFTLERKESGDEVSFAVRRFKTDQLSNEKVLRIYINDYMNAIPHMYNELASYKEEIMREITLLHLNSLRLCLPCNLDDHNLEQLVDEVLKERA